MIDALIGDDLLGVRQFTQRNRLPIAAQRCAGGVSSPDQNRWAIQTNYERDILFPGTAWSGPAN